MKRHILCGLLGIMIVLLLAWCGGFDFDSRGEAAFIVCLMALSFFASGVAISNCYGATKNTWLIW